ncbi:hypothetical protein HAX54_031395 [Datura stramonium]|uniref:Uncharacterized protein n=1 Tax=Datura stramonium TaxID=4076 RepID=A0ABS8VBK2_DATST|nr:hypothetical protein [Datura stramonium]
MAVFENIESSSVDRNMILSISINVEADPVVIHLRVANELEVSPWVSHHSKRLKSLNDDVGVSNIEAPSLSEYCFNIDPVEIVEAIGSIKDVKWLRPIRSDPNQHPI